MTEICKHLTYTIVVSRHINTYPILIKDIWYIKYAYFGNSSLKLADLCSSTYILNRGAFDKRHYNVQTYTRKSNHNSDKQYRMKSLSIYWTFSNNISRLMHKDQRAKVGYDIISKHSTLCADSCT